MPNLILRRAHAAPDLIHLRVRAERLAQLVVEGASGAFANSDPKAYDRVTNAIESGVRRSCLLIPPRGRRSRWRVDGGRYCTSPYCTTIRWKAPVVQNCFRGIIQPMAIRRGRRKLSPDDVRQVAIRLRVTATTRQEIEAAALAAGMKASEWLRRAALAALGKKTMIGPRDVHADRDPQEH